MCEPRYNLPSDVRITDEASMLRVDEAQDTDNLSPCQTTGTQAPTEGSNAPTVSGRKCLSTSPRTAEEIALQREQAAQKRRDKRRWRRQNGHFVAKETGEVYQDEVDEYDPRSAEKAPSRDVPLSESQVTQERANLREDLKKPEGHPARRTTLEGIYFWISAYMALSDEEKAKLEGEVQRGQ